MECLPTISVIVPVYNVEKYLDRCLVSLLNQTLKDIEIILVDDGSPDNCPQMCDDYAAKDCRVKVVHKKNAGLGFARNSGLEVATGKYVAFVDSDDFVDLSMYEKLLKTAENDGADIVYCGVNQQLDNGKIIKWRDYTEHTVFEKELVEKVAISFNGETEITRHDRLFMSVWHSIYRKALIDENKLCFYSEREIVSEDLPFQVEICSKANVISFIPDCLYTYCYNGESLTHNFKLSMVSAFFKLRSLLHDFFKNNTEASRLIDSDLFYERVRGYITLIIFAKNLSIKEKIKSVKAISNSKVWAEIDMSFMYKKRTWKYMKQYELLKANRPYALIAFSIFDKYVNKERLMWWKK